MVGAGSPRRRTLVILAAQDRELSNNLEFLENNLLNPLDADLAICGTTGPESDGVAFAYKWSFPEPADWIEAMMDSGLSADGLDLARSVGPEFFAGFGEEPGSAAIVYFWRHKLSEKVTPLLEGMHYEWFVVTRSDMRWTVPFPKIENFDPSKLYFLDGQHYGGMSDRFVLFPHQLAAQVVGLYSPIFTETTKTISELIAHRFSQSPRFRKFNAEFYLKFELDRAGLLRKARFLPYLGYAIRSEQSATRWSAGAWDEREGLRIKYPAERREARFFRKWIRHTGDWGRFPRGTAPWRVWMARLDWNLKKIRRRLRAVDQAGEQLGSFGA